jgi:hypothetical protein
MTDNISRPRRTARLTGLLYLVTIAGGMAGLTIGEALYSKGDAAATAGLILGSEGLYRLGLMAVLIGVMAYVAVTALLYELLRPACRTLSLTAAFFSLVGCAAWAGGAVFGALPLTLLKPWPALQALPADHLQAMAMIAIRMNDVCWEVGMAFFGVYCILLGALVMRSRFIPGFIGVLLFLAGSSHLIGVGLTFLFPAWLPVIAPWTNPLGIAGEGGLTLWLLVMGVNERRWRAQAAAQRVNG